MKRMEKWCVLVEVELEAHKQKKNTISNSGCAKPVLSIVSVWQETPEDGGVLKNSFFVSIFSRRTYSSPEPMRKF